MCRIPIGDSRYDPRRYWDGHSPCHEGSAAALVDYLGWYGIAAKHRHMPTIEGAGVGQQLLSAAEEDGANLLVMGGYGHVPWREFLFGGATRDVVGASLLPVLLTH